MGRGDEDDEDYFYKTGWNSEIQHNSVHVPSSRGWSASTPPTLPRCGAGGGRAGPAADSLTASLGQHGVKSQLGAGPALCGTVIIVKVVRSLTPHSSLLTPPSSLLLTTTISAEPPLPSLSLLSTIQSTDQSPSLQPPLCLLAKLKYLRIGFTS